MTPHNLKQETTHHRATRKEEVKSVVVVFT